jgi:hypothetical protein
MKSEEFPYVVMTAIGKPKEVGEETSKEWEYYEFRPSYVSKINSNYAIKTISFGSKIPKDGIKRHPDCCSDELAQLMATWGILSKYHLYSYRIINLYIIFSYRIF